MGAVGTKITEIYLSHLPSKKGYFKNHNLIKRSKNGVIILHFLHVKKLLERQTIGEAGEMVVGKGH